MTERVVHDLEAIHVEEHDADMGALALGPPEGLLETSDEIHAVRQQGFAYCYGRVTPGVGAISMSLPGSADEPAVVLAVSGSGTHFIEQRDEIAAAMRERIDRYIRDRRGDCADRLFSCHNSSNGMTIAHGLSHRHNIWRKPCFLVPPEMASQSTKAGLYFVCDDQTPRFANGSNSTIKKANRQIRKAFIHKGGADDHSRDTDVRFLQ